MKAELLHGWGSDLTVVNNARVSFAKEADWILQCRHCGAITHQPSLCGGPCVFEKKLAQEDIRLIGYLVRGITKAKFEDMIEELKATGEDEEIIDILNRWRRTPEHWAPFANGVGLQFHIKAPIPIMRQVFKHKIGAVESEVSRRYVDDDPEVFYPRFRWRPMGGVKQGSGHVMDGISGITASYIYEEAVGYALMAYDKLLELKVAPEQARFILPQGTYTEARISNSLYGWANFYNQRHDRSHAQAEIADIADQIAVEAQKRFPVSWQALTS